jgi:hypothetical protein
VDAVPYGKVKDWELGFGCVQTADNIELTEGKYG